MHIVIAGGSGQLGTMLATHFQRQGHTICVLARQVHDRPWPVVEWDARTRGAWYDTIDGADVVINLAGRSVNCRYTEDNQQEIMRSRVDSTRILGEAIAAASSPPRTWLQASTATIYAHSYTTQHDEYSGVIGGNEPDVPRSWDFSVKVASTWECTLDEAPTPHTRKVAMRSTIILSPDEGGIFDVMMGLVGKGLGGTNGNGKQMVSWMHDVDFVRAVDFLIAHEELSGPVNLASPEPVPNAHFMKIMRDAAAVPIGLPAMAWMIKIGAVFMGTEPELVLKSRNVVPKKLLDAGFTFEFPIWHDAAKDLVTRRAHR